MSIKMTDEELKALFDEHGIKMPRSYKSKTTGTMCFNVKHSTYDTVVSLSKKYGINKSQVVQLIIDSIED
jgi:hypothetical protein